MNPSQPATVRDITLNLLRRHGMTTVFGNPGSTEVPFLRNWPEDFQYVLGLPAAPVVAMADGFAQAARKPVLVNGSVKDLGRPACASWADRPG